MPRELRRSGRRRVGDLVNDPYGIETETRDPNDDYLIALARAYDVDVIVSGDKDLLEWEDQRPPS